MREILSDHPPWIRKSQLSIAERNPMFRAVFPVFLPVPIETGFGHELMVSKALPISHTFVWFTIGAWRDP